MVTVTIGELRQEARLWNPGPPVPNGDGGYTPIGPLAPTPPGANPPGFVPCTPPTWRCAIERASVSMSMRHFASTVVAHASYIFTGRFHPQLSAMSPTRIEWTDRAGTPHIGNVVDVSDTEGAGVQSMILVSEVAF